MPGALAGGSRGPGGDGGLSRLRLRHAHRIVHLAEDRGLKEVTILKLSLELWPFASRKNRSAFLARNADITLDLVELIFRNLRSH